MNKDFERCCSFLADMIIKYAPEIKEEVEGCMMIKGKYVIICTLII